MSYSKMDDRENIIFNTSNDSILQASPMPKDGKTWSKKSKKISSVNNIPRNPHLVHNKDIILTINNEKNNNPDVTQYYSAQSSFHLGDNHPLNNVNSFTNQSHSYHSSLASDTVFKLNNLEDSFDSNIDETGDSYNKADYITMNEYIKNEDYNKLRDLQNKLLKDEIEKRKERNLKRLNKLNKLQDKMYNLEKKTFDNFSKSTKLVLANTEPDLGYYIVPEDKFLLDHQEQKFCDYIFYTKK
jgi:hypothetical protein